MLRCVISCLCTAEFCVCFVLFLSLPEDMKQPNDMNKTFHSNYTAAGTAEDFDSVQFPLILLYYTLQQNIVDCQTAQQKHTSSLQLPEGSWVSGSRIWDTKTLVFHSYILENLDLLTCQSTFYFRCKQQYSLWATFYLLKVGFNSDLQLLKVGSSELTL